jgi:hypothetical protein
MHSLQDLFEYLISVSTLNSRSIVNQKKGESQNKALSSRKIFYSFSLLLPGRRGLEDAQESLNPFFSCPK